MHDLIYCDENSKNHELQELIKQEFPQVKIEDVSDEIYDYRFSVELPDEFRDDFMVFVIKNGFALNSLEIQMHLRISDNKKELKDWMQKAGV